MASVSTGHFSNASPDIVPVCITGCARELLHFDVSRPTMIFAERVDRLCFDLNRALREVSTRAKTRVCARVFVSLTDGLR